MTAFSLAFLATFLWSIVNVVDKFLLEKYVKNTGVGGLILLSSLFPVVLLPIAWFIAGTTLLIDNASIAVLLFSGVLTVLWISFYLYALEEEEVSVVMPLFQLTPVFALLFGFILLSELPTGTQLLFGAIVLLGSLMLSVDRKKRRVKIKLVIYLSISSATIALMLALFKFIAVDESFWVSIFWHATGTMLTGVVLYLCHDTFRAQFHAFLKRNIGIGLSLNSTNETLTLVGDVLFAGAVLLAPLAIVQTVEAFQPVFVFLIGVFLTLFLPRIIIEDLSKGAVTQKIAGILLVVIGSIGLHF